MFNLKNIKPEEKFTSPLTRVLDFFDNCVIIPQFEFILFMIFLMVHYTKTQDLGLAHPCHIFGTIILGAHTCSVQFPSVMDFLYPMTQILCFGC